MSAPFTIVFALYPRVTQLDFTGPFEVFARLPGAQCILAAVSAGDIQADTGITFANIRRLADIDRAALLCVPGGTGVTQALADEEYIAQVRRLSAQAEYVTSVCTGSLLLGAAGVLRGKRAACHWAYRELLRPFGAIPDAARVVTDGNIITGGGVTAGIDLGLTVMAQIAGAEYAQGVQLALEYAPAPPFQSGRPEHAPVRIVEDLKQRVKASMAEREAAVARAAAAMNARD